MINVAITYNATVGGISVLSLQKAFKTIGCNVIDADYRICGFGIPDEEFHNPKKQAKIWGHLKSTAAIILKDAHCLVLSGSNSMIDPHLFNMQREHDKKYDFQRAMAELALTHIAIYKGMPILACCFGHQLLSVYFGGTLKNLSFDELKQQNFHGDDKIYFQSGCVLSKIVGQEIQTFFGSHRQVVDQLGKGLQPCGIASDGYSNEAFESEFQTPIIATQFHPEVTLHGLVNSSKIYRGDFSSQRSSLNIFMFMKDAAETYSKKLAVIKELRKPKIIQKTTKNVLWKKIMKMLLLIFFPWFVFMTNLQTKYLQFVEDLQIQDDVHQSPFYLLNNSPSKKWT